MKCRLLKYSGSISNWKIFKSVRKLFCWLLKSRVSLLMICVVVLSRFMIVLCWRIFICCINESVKFGFLWFVKKDWSYW